MSVVVNDIHARLNESRVSDVIAVNDLDAVQAAVRRAANEGLSIAIAGGRHAMGGQQFCADGLLLDTRGMRRILGFDVEEGTIEVEAGIEWPNLIEYLVETQEHRQQQWGIAQKQTGADRLSIGGALAANVHGRGLTMKPMIADVESFVLVGPSGDPVTCSRDERPELFRLAIGGYGLFGCIYSARIRLLPRRTLERVVEVRMIEELDGLFEDRIANGFQYGDFQFATDDATDDFLRRGVFSCYRPIEDSGPPPADQRALSDDDWQQLIYLAHTNKAEAFERYAAHYLATSGQIYYSDAHQLAGYADGYHVGLDAILKAPFPSTEMITEVYVPRDRLGDFMAAAAEQFRSNGANVIYGTIRLIERDEESVLAWATDRWACIIFNLCVPHTPDGVERAADAFRGLIDLAIERGGKYYLTYHRWARRDQVERCYPQFVEFLRAKRSHDPDGRFESDWYRHYATMFADVLE